MEVPDYAPNCIAELMKSCWKVNANERPTFSSIQQTLSNQLESSVTSEYLQLSEEYEKLHVERMDSLNLSFVYDDIKLRNSHRLTVRPTSSTDNAYVENPAQNSQYKKDRCEIIDFNVILDGRRKHINVSLFLI